MRGRVLLLLDNCPIKREGKGTAGVVSALVHSTVNCEPDGSAGDVLPATQWSRIQGDVGYNSLATCVDNTGFFIITTGQLEPTRYGKAVYNIIIGHFYL